MPDGDERAAAAELRAAAAEQRAAELWGQLQQLQHDGAAAAAAATASEAAAARQLEQAQAQLATLRGERQQVLAAAQYMARLRGELDRAREEAAAFQQNGWAGAASLSQQQQLLAWHIASQLEQQQQQRYQQQQHQQPQYQQLQGQQPEQQAPAAGMHAAAPAQQAAQAAAQPVSLAPAAAAVPALQPPTADGSWKAAAEAAQVAQQQPLAQQPQPLAELLAMALPQLQQEPRSWA